MQSDALISAVDDVISSWQREGVSLTPPITLKAVKAELSKTGQRISKDVVDLYCRTGGMAKNEMDSHCFSMWPFDTVTAVNSDRPYLAFADFLIDSHWYGFVYESETHSKVCIDYGKELEIIADSVEDFFRRILNDPRSLYLLVDSSL